MLEQEHETTSVVNLQLWIQQENHPDRLFFLQPLLQTPLKQIDQGGISWHMISVRLKPKSICAVCLVIPL